jgi:hypothetical protein
LWKEWLLVDLQTLTQRNLTKRRREIKFSLHLLVRLHLLPEQLVSKKLVLAILLVKKLWVMNIRAAKAKINVLFRPFKGSIACILFFWWW